MLTFYILFVKFILGLRSAEKLKRLTVAARHFAAVAFDALTLLGAAIVFFAFKAIKSLKGYSFKVTPRFVCACVSMCICLTACAVAAMSTAAVAVVVNGNVVGYVENVEAAEAASKLVYGSFIGDGYGIAEIEYKNGFAFKSDIASVEKTAASALGSIDGLQKKCGLFVDGMLTAVADNAREMQSMIDALVASYETDDRVFCGFSNDVLISEVYLKDESYNYPADTLEEFLNGVTGIGVKTCRVESFEQEVPYETEYTYDLTKIKGYKYVKKAGKNGLSLVTAEVTYINGVRSSAEVISSTVIEEPTAELAVAGMCDEAIAEIRYAAAVGEAAEENEKMLLSFPCERTERTYISSYWGDGRGHQGIDIASPYGSDIYAAAGGTVTFSGWYTDYGKCVIIDHPDGKTRTIYSHCSSLLVEKGQTVSADQLIAKVGSTGRSTGNHLHFSVLINGVQVDPSPYLGIK